MRKPTVLIIDDEKNLVSSLMFSLEEEEMTVFAAYDGKSGLAEIEKQTPDVVLLDLKLPDQSGFEVLDQVQALPAPPVTIMISAHGDTRAAVEAVKKGAQDYITKPFDLDELILLIQRNHKHRQLTEEVAYRRERESEVHGLVGHSLAMQKLLDQVERIGKSSARTILLQGPSGSGKTLIAKALHATKDKAAPFVSVNCASLPENLLEAELFGAEKGAYTGADKRRTGLVELANGGTLFLDEIGELPLTLQAKLLTFLETHRFRAVGGQKEIDADLRVIAASNRDLQTEAQAGTFREDLFYRLNVMPLTIPSLAERKEDIPVLTSNFVTELAAQEGCKPIRLTPETLTRLCNYDWPGNIRELRNTIERLTILHAGESISVDRLPPEIIGSSDQMPLPVTEKDSASNESHGSLTSEIAKREAQCILDALAQSNGRKGEAANSLGISRHALKRRMQKLGLTGDEL
ncbi:sigma-54-dependent Fis family transcriptional regulator [Marinobacter adhaerens]|uniref:Acetoacetate metabolism regulatory protein AtoC n=1 Tax=Marinobacter salsuginis TaxID=418719 RepID=A0A5M3PRM6_9GAMM|nr:MULTISPECIES: sigma-54 dependent transcriptional regulator [Marinobacter]ODM28611.1 sigma-54-dependent Fis family transcriptional regulator [Marinobacter adhaerens]GBO85555.1 acetoacetate metabolism regulatory protein AtoC [Marinobacter salsuginis]